MANLASAAALRPASAAKAPSAARRSAGRTISKRLSRPVLSRPLSAQNSAQLGDLRDLPVGFLFCLIEFGAVGV